MTAFLIVLVIILFGVAVWQMSKIFEMSKPSQAGEHEIASEKDNNVNGWLMLSFVIFIYAILAFCFWKWFEVLLPEAASEHGVEIDNLMLITMVLIFVVGIITQWLLHYFAGAQIGSQYTHSVFALALQAE